MSKAYWYLLRCVLRKIIYRQYYCFCTICPNNHKSIAKSWVYVSKYMYSIRERVHIDIHRHTRKMMILLWTIHVHVSTPRLRTAVAYERSGLMQIKVGSRKPRGSWLSWGKEDRKREKGGWCESILW